MLDPPDVVLVLLEYRSHQSSNEALAQLPFLADFGWRLLEHRRVELEVVLPVGLERTGIGLIVALTNSSSCTCQALKVSQYAVSVPSTGVNTASSSPLPQPATAASARVTATSSPVSRIEGSSRVQESPSSPRYGILHVMVPESKLEKTEHGLVPKGEGWYVLNMRDAEWRHADGRGAVCVVARRLRGLAARVRPARRQPVRAHAGRADGHVPLGGRSGGLPRRLGRGGPDRRGRGAAAARVGLRALPAEHEARDRRGRKRSVPRDRGRRSRARRSRLLGFTVDEVAKRHGASVEEDTTDGDVAYASLPSREPTAYRDGWLPE